MKRRTFLSTFGVAATSLAMPLWSRGQATTRPLRLLVAGAVGSVPDTRARWLADRLTGGTGATVVVDTRPGVGGAIAMTEAVRASADGSVLVMAHQGVLAIYPHLAAKPGYEPLTDFSPVTRFGWGPLLVSVHPDVPARTLPELIEMARKNPGAVRYATPGVGTPPHLATELMLRAAGVEATHVPSKGGGEALRAVLSGQLELAIEGAILHLPHVRAGKLRALAVTTAERSSVAPDVPTVAESGVPGYEFTGWSGLVVPSATPRDVIARLHADIAAVGHSDAAREWFGAVGAQAGIQTPEAFGALIRTEHSRLGKLVRDADIRIG